MTAIMIKMTAATLASAIPVMSGHGGADGPRDPTTTRGWAEPSAVQFALAPEESRTMRLGKKVPAEVKICETPTTFCVVRFELPSPNAQLRVYGAVPPTTPGRTERSTERYHARRGQ